MSGGPPSVSRVALVTGGGRGIGAAIARRLADDGHRVAVCDRDAESSAALAHSISRGSGDCISVHADVADASSVRAMVDDVEHRLGAPEILVNNAGVISVSPIIDLEESEWDRIMAVNLKSQFLCSRAVLPAMRERGWGRIVNIASDAGKTAEALIAHYSASKFGVIGLTQSIALEFARDGITANAVCPAITQTDMMAQLARDLDAASPDGAGQEQWRRSMVEEIPLGRAMAVEDIAETCAFLVSERAGAISGQAINVSGAHEMH